LVTDNNEPTADPPNEGITGDTTQNNSGNTAEEPTPPQIVSTQTVYVSETLLYPATDPEIKTINLYTYEDGSKNYSSLNFTHVRLNYDLIGITKYTIGQSEYYTKWAIVQNTSYIMGDNFTMRPNFTENYYNSLDGINENHLNTTTTMAIPRYSVLNGNIVYR
jgi:hypothetical protein